MIAEKQKVEIMMITTGQLIWLVSMADPNTDGLAMALFFFLKFYLFFLHLIKTTTTTTNEKEQLLKFNELLWNLDTEKYLKI